MGPDTVSSTHSWTQLDAMPQQVQDAGMGSTQMVVVQPAAGAQQVSWLPPNGVAWFQTAESAVDSTYHECSGGQTSYVRNAEMVWMDPNVLAWQQGLALDGQGMQSSQGTQHGSESLDWPQNWQPSTEAVPYNTSNYVGSTNLASDGPQQGLLPDGMAWVPVCADDCQLLPVGMVVARAALTVSEEDQVVRSACSGSEKDLLPPGEECEDSEDDELANSAVSALPRRRRRQHRAGRRRRRAAVRRAERQQQCPPTLALAELRGRHVEVPVTELPVETHESHDSFAAECMAKFESGEEEEECAALAALRGMVLALSFEPQGCRVVQRAFEIAGRGEQEALAEELRGHVRDAVTSPHANHVVAKIVEVLPAGKAAFVPEELQGIAVLTASHRYGCRIICRIVEHPGSDQRNELISEILAEADEVCRSVYGHHVISSIMEHGSVQQRKWIVTALRSGGLLRYARNRHASYVLEKAFAFADREDNDLLSAELLSNPDNVSIMAESQFGCHVVEALIKKSQPGYSQIALAYLSQDAKRLEASKFGRRLLEEFKLCPPVEHKPH